MGRLIFRNWLPISAHLALGSRKIVLALLILFLKYFFQIFFLNGHLYIPMSLFWNVQLKSNKKRSKNSLYYILAERFVGIRYIHYTYGYVFMYIPAKEMNWIKIMVYITTINNLSTKCIWNSDSECIYRYVMYIFYLARYYLCR